MTLIKRVHISEEITLILRKAKLANLTLILRVNVSREDRPTKNTGHQSRWTWIYNDWPKDMTPTAYTPGPKGRTVTSWVDGPRDTTLIQRVDGPKDMTPGCTQSSCTQRYDPYIKGRWTQTHNSYLQGRHILIYILSRWTQRYDPYIERVDGPLYVG